MNTSLGFLDKLTLARELGVSARTIELNGATRPTFMNGIKCRMRFDIQKVKVALERFEVRGVDQARQSTAAIGIAKASNQHHT